ncbi:response regulator [Zobellella endophytica]|uniref:Response regulator n=1 Tax=Zobellella endophytica TaxID=2116700 RepID=A0A2P7R942_9GAMM|nr:response regulator [Zobellella endophytica]PSJ46748.1 response regulator [Zobellella endophytica]
MANQVLIVEDEDIFAQNLRLYLEHRGLQVRVAGDGAGAIGLVGAGFVPDLVVLDFCLPDMDGFQLFDILSRERDYRWLLMTAHSTGEVYDEAMRRGISHMMFKPFPLRELARAVSVLLERAVGEGEGPVLAERRHRRGGAHFPLQMYDGTWVFAERRRPEVITGMTACGAEAQPIREREHK